MMVRVLANGSIPGRVLPKTQKMVLDASLFNVQHYKLRIKGKVEQSRERSIAPLYTLVLELSKREHSCHLRLLSPTLLIFPRNIYRNMVIILVIQRYLFLCLIYTQAYFWMRRIYAGVSLVAQ